MRGFACIAAFAVLTPAVATAQDIGDSTFDVLLKYVPTKYMPLVLTAWGIVYYFIAPLVKSYVKADATNPNAPKNWLIRLAEWITQDSHRPPPVKGQATPTAATSTPPKGFARLPVLVALLIAALAAVPFVARAQTPPAEPKFGGCLSRYPATCFSPAVSVNVLAMSIKDGALTSTFDPGIGYGVTVFSDQWYRVGATATFAFPTLGGSRRVEPALLVSFAEYARLGFACPLYMPGGLADNGQLLLGFGADFGRW